MFSLASRPKQLLEGKQDEQLDVSSRRNELVYVRNCIRCKVNVKTPSAKLSFEKCEQVEVILEGLIVSGTLDIYNCTDLKIHFGTEISVPVVTIEKSGNTTLSVTDPKKQTESIYVLNSTDVNVLASGSVFPVSIPPKTDADCQLTSRWTGQKFETEKVVREGAHGYPTTASKKAAADAKQAELEKRFNQVISDSVKAFRKPAPAAASKPKAQEANLPPQPQPKKSPISFTGSDLEKTKDKLKPAETIERRLPVVGVPSGSSSRAGGGTTGPDTAIKDEEGKKEYFETPDDFAKKLNVLAKWVKSSKHVIIFTGAGISTSTGIPDFRSGMNTVLETGPGVWELRAQGAKRSTQAKTVSMLQAIPSTAHMAIVELHKRGIVKATVSQNVDGLHLRSGIPADQIAELHGNTNLETCKRCGRRYLRDFETRTALGVFNHETKRVCDDVTCKGQLYDSIINFGENLPEDELQKAFDHAKKADLCIVLGSSLRVTPAACVPETVKEHGGKLVICNLQRTPLDSIASMTIHAKCDDVMKGLVKDRLHVEIPSFKLQRRMKLHLKQNMKKSILSVSGLDVHFDLPYSFIRKVEVQATGKSGKNLAVQSSLTVEPFATQIISENDDECKLKLQFEFLGHYGEASLEIVRNVCLGKEWAIEYQMTYDPLVGTWQVKSF